MNVLFIDNPSPMHNKPEDFDITVLLLKSKGDSKEKLAGVWFKNLNQMEYFLLKTYEDMHVYIENMFLTMPRKGERDMFLIMNSVFEVPKIAFN